MYGQEVLVLLRQVVLICSRLISLQEFSAGSITLTLTSTNNGICNADSDLVKIDFVPPPFANFSANNVCLGNPTNFIDFSLQGFGAVSQRLYDLGDGSTETNKVFLILMQVWNIYC